MSALVFTDEHRAAQEAVREWQRSTRRWDGKQFVNPPHPALADLADLPQDEAARRMEAFHLEQGYAQYAGAWTDKALVLIVITRRVATKSGVAFEAGERVVGFYDEDRHLCAFSARNLCNTALPGSSARVEP